MNFARMNFARMNSAERLLTTWIKELPLHVRRKRVQRALNRAARWPHARSYREAREIALNRASCQYASPR